MLNMPILKFEKSTNYLNSQLEIQTNNKQLVLDIIANMGLILNNSSEEKQESFSPVLESANNFLQTVSSNITNIEQLLLEISNITKELSELLSEENKKTKSKEFYIAAFSNIKHNMIEYSKKFQDMEEKLENDNKDFNEFINENNFKYTFETTTDEENESYTFTGFSIDNDTSSEENIIEDAVIEGNIIENNVIEENVVEENIIEDNVIEDTVIEGNILEDNVIEENVVEENIIEDNVIEGNILEDNVIEENVIEENILEDNVIEDTVIEGNILEDNVIEENFIEENILEDNVIEDTVIEGNILEDNVIEENFIEENDYNLDETDNNLIENYEQIESETVEPIDDKSRKIDELTSEFRSLLLSISNSNLSHEETASAITSLFKEVLPTPEVENVENNDIEIAEEIIENEVVEESSEVEIVEENDEIKVSNENNDESNIEEFDFNDINLDDIEITDEDIIQVAEENLNNSINFDELYTEDIEISNENNDETELETKVEVEAKNENEVEAKIEVENEIEIETEVENEDEDIVEEKTTPSYSSIYSNYYNQKLSIEENIFSEYSSFESSSNFKVPTNTFSYNTEAAKNTETILEENDEVYDNIEDNNISNDLLTSIMEDSSLEDDLFENNEIIDENSLLESILEDTDMSDISSDNLQEEIEEQKQDVKINESDEVDEKIEKILKAESNNSTLIFSEKTNSIYLPYTSHELVDYIESYPDSYKSLQDVVKQEFILPLNYFSEYPAKARFSEAFTLMKNREGNPFLKSVSYASRLINKKGLNPAIIAACKTQNELDSYIYYLDNNNIENFKYFDIIYAVNPLKNK